VSADAGAPVRPEARRPGYENRLVVVMFCLVGCIFIDRMSAVFLAPLYVNDLHLSNLEVGGVVAALSVGWGISGWVFGSLSDRVGRRRVLLPAAFVFSAVSAVTGLVQSFVQFVLARLLMGASEGAAWAPMTAILAAESTPARRGFNIGAAQSAVSLIGVAIAPVITTQLAVRFGWRAAFFIAAIPGLIVAIVLVRFLREPQRRPEHAAGPAWSDVRTVLANRNLRLSIAVGILLGAWIAVMSVFTPLFLTRVDGLSLTTMGVLIGVSGLGGFAGSLLLPMLSDRVGRRPALVVGLVMLSCSSWLIAVVGANPLVIGVVWGFFAIGQGAFPLAAGVVPTESVPTWLGATAVAVPAFAIETIGGTIGPVVAGAAADAIGPAAPLLIAGGLALAAALISFLYVETAPRLVNSVAPAATRG